MGWVIFNINEPDLCWNETEGAWSSLNYDTFDDEERFSIVLPVGGEWEQVAWEKDEG